MIHLRNLLLTSLFLAMGSEALAQQSAAFTAAEQQQISVVTPRLFERSQAFTIDFNILKDNEYAFPLPVGKAAVVNGQALEIVTAKGDAVKAMFGGVVRMSRKTPQYGNVVVIRHDNGLETVYGYNAQNLVKVGQRVRAGQTVAIVGGTDEKVYCLFALMVNGGWINPSIILDPGSHRLRRAVVQCRKAGNRVEVTVVKAEKCKSISLDPDEVEEDPFLKSATFKLDLEAIGKDRWAYPLPGSHVISPYGGARHHSGVDIKTRPNDNVLAAFDGVVVRSGPFAGYGNCITIRHAYGFETLYSHQSKNLVKAGDKVKAGQVIGLTGRTGRATTEHLHFEVKFKGRRLNPAVLFDHAKKKLQATMLVLGSKGSVSSKKN
ncbi:M23 family metallopeptidase [[Hallella] seregens]|uniref:M23 family metallopeptidase n=1 Tax=Hallella seregens ATCC 51272 TaxID=1336250 RepID=A0ABV5ZKL1_9BACT|nr:M23 family metallopeptidase [Hallella seregens]